MPVFIRNATEIGQWAGLLMGRTETENVIAFEILHYNILYKRCL